MKIGIVGSAEAAVAWENHLQPNPSVSELQLSTSLSSLSGVDACIILNYNTNTLLQAIRQGLHVFMVAPLTESLPLASKIHHTTQEANVKVQFSHWPSLAPSSRWMKKQLPKPGLIQINREIPLTTFRSTHRSLKGVWVNELAFCMNYVDSSIYSMQLNAQPDLHSAGHLHMHLRFDNGTTAAIFINTTAELNRHQRVLSNKKMVLECNVQEQYVRLATRSAEGRLTFNSNRFDAQLSAEHAANLFVDAIESKGEPAYGSHHLYSLSRQLKTLNN